MCGRAASSALATATAATALSLDLDEASRANTDAVVGAKNPAPAPSKDDAVKDMPNAGPGNAFHVFRRSAQGTAELERAPMIWGLIPNHGTERRPHPLPVDADFSVSAHYAMFNARSETLCDKPSFRGLVRHGQTCVVPLEGYYEWLPPRPHARKKQPYFIRRKDAQRPLLMAGVWARVKTGRRVHKAGVAQAEDETLTSFAILTTEAHPDYAWLHPRQPVMLWDTAVAREWLRSPNAALVARLRSVPVHGSGNGDDRQRPLWETAALSVHPVTTRMNACAYQGDDCTSEVTLETVPSVASFFSPRGSKRAKTEAAPAANTPSSAPILAGKRKDFVSKTAPEAVARNGGAKEPAWTCSKCTFVHAGAAKREYLACELCQAVRHDP